MDKDALYEAARDALKESELTVEEIPAIDLYMDQILNLVSDKLKQGSERYYDRQLTKTMINNYSKDGLITPIKGKKYGKEQIVQILTVYTLKNTLSIGEIKRVLNGMYAEEGFDGEALAAMYDRHLAIKEENRALSMELLERLMERDGLDVEDTADYVTAAGALLSLSAQLKQIAQAMIDVRFPEPEESEEPKESKEEKRQKKEQEKHEKQEKKEKKEKKEKQEKQKKPSESMSAEAEEILAGAEEPPAL